MAQPSDRERLVHVAEAIDRIIEFLDPMDYDEFRLDHRTRLSVERLLEIMGEAANHISQGLKDRHPEVPWREITDLRNVVSHEYYQIRLEVIWEVAIHEVPPLREQIRTLILDLEGKSGDG